MKTKRIKLGHKNYYVIKQVTLSASSQHKQLLMNKAGQRSFTFTHPQSHQLRTTKFKPGVLLASFQQSRKPYHSLKISTSLRRPARLKPDNFSKSKPEPGSNNPSPIDNSVVEGQVLKCEILSFSRRKVSSQFFSAELTLRAIMGDFNKIVVK